MYIPEPKKNKDGTWSIQLRINKQSIMVNADSAKECKRRAAIVKAEAQNAAKPIKKSELTLTQAIDEYINTRQNSLSPSTIRGYRIIQRTRFQSTMPRRISTIQQNEWRKIIDEELGVASKKTVKNSWAFVKSVLKENGITPDDSVKVAPQRISSRVFSSASWYRIHQFSSAAFSASKIAVNSARASKSIISKWPNKS